MLTKIAHITLSALVFISTTGFLFNTHYCRDVLKSKAFFLEAEACDHSAATTSCALHGNMPVDQSEDDESRDCCEDKSELLKTEDQYISHTSDVQLQDIIPVFGVMVVLLNIDLPETDSRTLHYLNYKPPLIVCDMPVSLQTFLC